MFGHQMTIVSGDKHITLKPLVLEDMTEIMAWWKMFSVVRYLGRTDVYTIEAQREWFKRKSEERDGVHWGIFIKGCDEPIGVTSLGSLDMMARSATSGIVIWNKSHWGQGVASLSHLARCLYAMEVMDLATINSHVRLKNEASLRALLKVGYIVVGHIQRTRPVEGKFMDDYRLQWFNPSPWVEPFLWRDGVELSELETELKTKALAGMEIAKEAMGRAKTLVTIE